MKNENEKKNRNNKIKINEMQNRLKERIENKRKQHVTNWEKKKKKREKYREKNNGETR